MARISASAQTSEVADLEDFEPYQVTLQSVTKSTGAEQYGSQPQLEVTWQLEDSTTVRDWPALKLGKSRDSGKVSKLRAMLNAIAGKPEAAEIAWFDDETFEWSYDGETAVARLTEGLPVIVRGKNVEKVVDGESQLRYRIQAYQPIKRSKPKPATEQAERRVRPAVVESTDDEDVPF